MYVLSTNSLLTWGSCIPITLGLAYNEFGYNEHPRTTSRFFSCMEIPSIDPMLQKFGYNEYRLQRAEFCSL